MKKILFFFAALLMGVSAWAQNNPPADVTATALSSTKVKVTWNTPVGTTQPTRLNLFDQSQMVTHPGAGANGADVSACYGGQNTWGENVDAISRYWVADDFTLASAAQIREIEFYTYQTGSTTTSTITGCYVSIYDTQPLDSTAVPVWTSDTVSCMTSTSWTGIYRTSATAMTDATRPIMRVVAGINTTLTAGTYWVSVGFTGSLTSGPWAPPVAILGQVSTGNAIHYLVDEGTWGPWADGASLEQMGMPFIVRGEFVSENLRGFNVYKDNEQINSDLIEGFYFVDDSLMEETEYCYTVEAVYTTGSAMSESVCATTLYNPCRIVSMPYSESFDTYGTGNSGYPNVAYPTCWTKINTTTSTSTSTLSYPYISSTYSKSSPGSLYMYAASGYFTMAITPLLDSNTIAINNLRATMMLYKGSAAYNLVVGTIVDPNDPNTFEPYDTISPSTTSTWQPFTVDFNNYTGNAHYIALRSGSGSATNSVYIDDFILDFLPTCEAPSNVTASPTSNSIVVSWTPSSLTPASSWDIEYQMDGDDYWLEANNITTPSYTIEDLEANTNYTFTFRVKSNCDNGDESAWEEETITIRTNCMSVTEFPYTESFDTYGTGTSAYPNCWSKSHTQTTTSVSYPYINTTYSTAPGAMYFYSTTSYGVWAVTPYFDANISMLQADFKLRKASANYKLAVGVMSNPDDINTFVGLDTLTPSTTSVWENFSVTFDSYTGSGHYIAFVSNFGATNGMYMDDLVIGEIQTCFAPTTISLGETTTSTATVVWNSTDEMASYDLRYRMVGEETWIVVPSISDTTYLLENLNSSSRYELQIQTICTDAVSYWSEVFNFQTMCSPVVELPYIEGFEDYGYSASGSEYPTCWSRPLAFNSSTTTAPFCNSSQHKTGAASLRFQGKAWAATPQIEEDLHNMQVSFWLRKEGANSGDFQVGVMSNPVDTSTFELVETIQPATTATWYYHEINLNQTQLSGTGNVIAFRQANTTYTNWYYWIDDVDVHIIPTCIKPYNLTSSDTTINSVELHWSDDFAVGNYEVQYKSVQDTEWILVSGISDTTYLLEGLSSSTIYDVQVRAVCTGEDHSFWSDVHNFSTLCGPVSELPYYEGFEYYGSGTTGHYYPTCWTRPVSYVSGTTTTAPFCNTSQYHSGGVSLRFQGKAWAATPQIDEDIHSLQVSFWLRKEGANSGDFQVGVMSNPADTSTFELVETCAVSATATWYYYEVNLNNTQLTGTGNYIAFRQANTTATAWYYWLDDVDVHNLSTCLSPTNLTVSNIGEETATLSWSANGNETGWELSYIAEGDEEWIEVTGIIDSTYQLTNLQPNTTYQYKIKALCDDGNESNYIFGSNFTTLCTPLDTLPFFENFDSYSSGVAYIPDCWIRHTDYTTNYPYISTTAYSGSRALYFYNSATTYCYAALPAFSDEVNIRDLQVSFKGRKSSSAYSLEVGVMSDPNDLSTYTVVTTVSPAATNTWEDFTVYLNSYTGTGKHIVLKTPAGVANYFYLDDIEVDYAPECLLPTNVRITNITSSEATVNWGASENETDWQIVYGPTGFSLDETEPISINVNPYTLTGLDPNTTYDVYLRTLCSNGEISEYTAVTTFTTGCAPLSLPYSEDFDSYGTGTTAYPTCWQKINNNTSFPYIYAMTASTGLTVPGAMYFSTTSTTYAYAILPEFDAELNTLQMSFAFKAATGNGYFLEVGVLEDLSDTSSFVPIQTIEPRTSVWNGFTVAFTAYEGTGKYIAIRSQRVGASNTCYIDNVVVDYAPGCVAPMHLEAENITTTSADIIWRPGRDESEWILAYGPKNFNPNVTGVSQTVNTYPVTLYDLEPGTFYDLYVKAVCNSDESSGWSIKGSFRTDCLLIDTLPYTESFDTYGTGTTAFPNCWYRNTTYSTTTQYPYISTTTPSTTPGSLYFYSTSTTYNYVTLPEFDESIDISSLRINFKLRKTSAAYHLKVGVMTDPSDKNTFVEVARVSPSTTSSWQTFKIDFYSYTGQGHFIAFASDTSSSNYMYLDDVSVIFAPSCHEVENVTVSDITTNSATVSWTPITEGASWEVEYGPAGFEQGSAAGTTVPSLDTFLVLSNLTSGTLYDVYVRQICSGNDESPWSDRVSFSTDCTPLSLPYTENFDNASYNATTYNTAGDAPLCWTTITNNTTYPAPHIVGSGASYYYYNSASNSLVFTTGSAGSDAYAVLPEFTSPLNTLKLNFWRAMESASYGTLYVGYVTDKSNIAATFTSVATITSIAHSGTGGGGVDSVDFSALSNIPTTGYIAFRWTYSSSYYSCCIDDINVTSSYVPVTDPTVVTNQASAIGTTTATLNGTITNPDNVEITACGFEWKAVSDADYTVVTLPSVTATMTHNLTGLTANTNYIYKAFITFNGDIVYGADVPFTTQEEGQQTCIVPTNLNATATAYNTADVNWTAGGTETSWNLQYKTASATDWGNSIAVNATTYHITGLNAETEYQVRVQANCGDDNTSEWTAPVSFTTPAEPVDPCGAPTGLTVNNITHNSATVSWTAGGDETAWSVQYKSDDASQWQEANVQTTSHTIEGLNPQTHYAVRVKAVCAPGSESGFLNGEFTTNPDAIDNITLANNINLMPNPADNYIDLRINSNVNVKEAVVYNAFGQMVQTVELNDNYARIDLNNMAAGMYFVRVNSDNVSATKKFIRK